jgi:hypothetical protein
MPLSFRWDVTGDGRQDDAFGMTPTLTWSQLQGLGITAGKSYLVTVFAGEGGGYYTISEETHLTVLDAPLQASPLTFNATQSTTFDGIVASFTDPGNTVDTSLYGVQIGWGDGNLTSGMVSLGSGGVFNILGSNVYARAGNYAVSVHISDSGGSVISTVSKGVVQPSHFIATGADSGGGPDVRVFDALTGTMVREFMAYDPHFNGGVRVALGNVDGDGDQDIVTAPGPFSGPDIRVFDGTSGDLVAEFMAYSPFFAGGVYIAVIDLNHDGFSDIITAPDATGGPEVKIFDGKSIMAGAPTTLADFMAYDPSFQGGVRVAAGDVNGDGIPDIITAPGAGGGPDVRIFSGANIANASPQTDILREFMAYSPFFTGGVYVAAADVNHDGLADIVTGAGAGGGPHVQVFSGADGSVLASFFAYDPSFSGGVRVGITADINGDGGADILTAPGSGMGGLAQFLDGQNQAVLDHFFAYDPHFLGGVFIGGQ